MQGAESFVLKGKEILDFKFLRKPLRGISPQIINITDSFRNLKLRKKPAIIFYKPDTLLGALQIQPTLNGVQLNKYQVHCIIENGYFIDLENKLFTVLEEDTVTLKSIADEVGLKGKLKKIADLRISGELVATEENIISSLIGQTDSLLEIETNGKFQHQLYPYQRHGVHWLLHCYMSNLGTILGDDMGLGKTAQIIALIAESVNRGILDRAMIVVPNSLIENWKREFLFFCPSIVPYVHYDSERTGLAQVLSPFKVVILPYTVMSADIEMLVDLEISLLVFDEASMLKNPDSARSKAARRLNAQTKIAMTGTPVENNLLDVWSLCNIVCPGYLGDKEGFKGRYIENNIADTLVKNLGGLERSISQIMLRRMKVDVLDDLPDKIDIHQPVALPPSERIEYDKIASDIRNSSTGGARVLQEITKLQKFTSHPSLTDGTNIDLKFDQLVNRSAKFERLFELLEEISSRSEKVLVFANHLAALDLIRSSVKEKFGLEAYCIDGRTDASERQDKIDIFSAIEGFSVLILNPKVAGMGLNITSANHVIHYSRQWNPALEEQATARAFRNGQTKDVNAYYLFYVDTIEEVIDERLRLKKQLANNVVSVVDNKSSEMDFFKTHI